MLTVLRGLPGSGKSAVAEALARRLNAAVLSVDPIEAAIWRTGIAPSFETGVAAYEVAAAVAQEQLRLGQHWSGPRLVLDSVEPLAANVERAVRYLDTSEP